MGRRNESPELDLRDECAVMSGEHTPDQHRTTERRSLHTPGPWAVEDPIGGELSIAEANKPTHEWKFIATVYLREGNDPDEFPHHVSEANARLIAAAPDLLSALKALMPEGDGWYDGTMDHMPGVKLARLAIAKAEGRL